MNVSFSVCSTILYHRKYLDFLLEHYDDLRLPYPFEAAFGYIASPVLVGRESFLCMDEENEVIGAWGYIHGTGEHDYENAHVIQIQAAYLSEPFRRTGVFFQGLQYLMEHLEQQDQGVTEILFWIGRDAYMSRLAAKFASLELSVESEYGPLEAYRVSVSELKDYLLRRFQTRAPA